MAQINRDCLGCMSLENIHLCTLYSITRYIRVVSARSYLVISRIESDMFLIPKLKVCGWIFLAALNQWHFIYVYIFHPR